MKVVPPLLLPFLTLLAFPVFADQVRLSHERLLKTELREARLISEIEGYAILAGRSCTDCDENTSIYIHKIADGAFVQPAEAERYTYPGQYADYLSKKVVERTRMFYGKCYENETALLWLSEYLADEGWVKSEYLIVFGEEGLEHRYNKDRQPSIFFIENSKCVELPGINVEIEP